MKVFLTLVSMLATTSIYAGTTRICTAHSPHLEKPITMTIISDTNRVPDEVRLSSGWNGSTEFRYVETNLRKNGQDTFYLKTMSRYGYNHLLAINFAYPEQNVGYMRVGDELQNNSFGKYITYSFTCVYQR